MKKLALASVAFAGITAFGAGDSFAAGFVGYTNANEGSFSATDTVVWSPVGATASGTANGTAFFAQNSTHKNLGFTAGFGGGGVGQTPTLTVFKQGTDIAAGFPAGMNVLADNTPGGGLGSITITSSGHLLDKLGFDLSPEGGGTWGATLTAYSGSVTGAHTKLGSVTISGANFCSHTGTTGCTSPQFIGVSDTSTPVSYVTLALTVSGPLVVGTLLETEHQAAAVPEPASLSALGAGLLGLGAFGRKRRSRHPDRGSRWSPFGRWRVGERPPDSTTS